MRASRRAVLLAGVAVLTGCTAPGPGPTAEGGGVEPERIDYGPGPDQFGELTRPSGTPRGTVVVVHGGFWRSQYGLDLGRPLAADLAARGYVAWNVEYRRTGGAGGWPATFEDVAAAVDHLAELDVGTDAVVAVGHSAGGHLAVWAAGRDRLPAGAPGAAPRVRLVGAVSQAGVLDLAGAGRDGLGGGAALDLLGGGPDEVPDRYALADPMALLPLGARVVCVHSPQDAIVPVDQSRRYVEAGTAAGADARLVLVEGDHFAVIDPADPAWAGGEHVRVAMTGEPS